MKKDKELIENGDQPKSVAGGRGLSDLTGNSFLAALDALSGAQLMNSVLDLEDPAGFVRSLAQEDLYWLIKKVGEDDALPLLQLASESQWQYLLDLEVWQQARLDFQALDQWVERLYQTDRLRLARWLVSEEGWPLGFYYFHRRLEIKVKAPEEAGDLPDGFFTLDGVFHLRARGREGQQTVAEILRTLASEDFQRFHGLLVNLGGLVPAEHEEEMYRLRNVRLAEHGFLPYEEALAVYAPLDAGLLSKERPGSAEPLPVEVPDERMDPVPSVPLFHAGAGRLTELLAGSDNPVFLERMRLEFAGLCNQIVVADRMTDFEVDDLLRVSRKAAGYVNVGLEAAAGEDFGKARGLLERNALAALFRVGFGQALNLRWEAERWVEGSWFKVQGLSPGFWGAPWGETLIGVLARKPVFYAGGGEPSEYRDFERLEEVKACRRTLRILMALDGLLERMTAQLPLDRHVFRREWPTFYPLLLNPFARACIGLAPAVYPLSTAEARLFLDRLREGRAEPPFPMTAFEGRFLETTALYGTRSTDEAAEALSDGLRQVWRRFQKEYEWVPPQELSPRLGSLIWLESAP